jgi:hypothetical protein
MKANNKAVIGRDLLAAIKAKALAYDRLAGECPHPEQIGDRWLVEVNHPTTFAYRASVACKMTERYRINESPKLPKLPAIWRAIRDRQSA